MQGPLPVHLAAVLDLSASPVSGKVAVRMEGDVVVVELAPSGPVVQFSPNGIAIRC